MAKDCSRALYDRQDICRLNYELISIFEYWPRAFDRYRDEPIKAAATELLKGRRAVIVSTDVVSFFDSVDPEFLAQPAFVETLTNSAMACGRMFSADRYIVATKSLLSKYSAFRKLRRRAGGLAIDTATGMPIGAQTSRVFANVALASLDTHITERPGVVLYRRYVDDVVIVTSADQQSPRPESKAAVLGSLFPDYRSGSLADQFVVPATGARFSLKESKTRVHDLAGTSGLEFLGVVQQAFSAVVSERRAFLGNVEQLQSSIENIDLFASDADTADRIPRLRNADRFTLRRFMVTAFVRGLQRCALLVGREEASVLLEQRTHRILSVIDGNAHLDDFEFVLSLLKVALLCASTPVVARLLKWLRAQSGEELESRIAEVSWCGSLLDRDKSVRLLASYLNRRINETLSASCSLDSSGRESHYSRSTLRNAAVLWRTGLRNLDYEDESTGSAMSALALVEKPIAEHTTARLAAQEDESLDAALSRVQHFMELSASLGEDIWTEVTNIGLFLTVKPPRYLDVARRFMARGESNPITLGVGAQIEACVDALRGTRYSRRKHPSFVLSGVFGDRTLEVRSDRAATTTRVILANLPVELAEFRAAAMGTPRLTLDRLKRLDHALRVARQAVSSAKRERRPSILVIPELAIPRRWVRALCNYAVFEEMSIIAGVEYDATQRGLVNQAIGVFPAGWRTAAIVWWTKRNPARLETSLLADMHLMFRRFNRLARLKVTSIHGRIGVLICSEILEVDALESMTQAIELLIVPSWNEDTPSFDHVAHAAASLLVHSFVCIANNAEASDSRIVAPVKEPRHEREWCRLVHRGENQVIWGDLPIAELRNAHSGGGSTVAREDTEKPKKKSKKERVYRPLPPQWRV